MLQGPEVPPEIRRLSLRSWRRGTKEMDLILGPWADRRLHSVEQMDVTRISALLDEEDTDIQDWIYGRAEPPERHVKVIEDLRVFHNIV